MLYIADLPRDLGVVKPFSVYPTLPEDRGISDITGDFGGKGRLLIMVESSPKARLRIPSIDGETFKGLLPMYAFASSAGEATSSSRT